MKRYGAKGQLSDPPQLGESVVVLAWEADDAIAKITSVALEQILGADDDLDQAIKEAYLLGQADMLAKCISAVEAQRDEYSVESIQYAHINDSILRLCSLQEKP